MGKTKPRVLIQATDLLDKKNKSKKSLCGKRDDLASLQHAMHNVQFPNKKQRPAKLRKG